MARYEHLKIYKDSYDALIVLNKLVVKFPKNFKYSMGQKMIDLNMEILKLIYKINNLSSPALRVFNLSKMLSKISELELYLRVLKDLNVISIKEYSMVALMVAKVAKQAQSWHDKLNIKKKEGELHLPESG